jgi:peptidoglycan DL-endopeptidase CwlO
MIPVATLGQPSSLTGERAQIAQLQNQLNSINTQAEAATNNYDGAMWRLQNAHQQIAANTAAITSNTKRLSASKAMLAARLRQVYASPQPDAIQVLLSTGNITSVTDTMDMLQHVGKEDAAAVSGVRSSLIHLTQSRAGLLTAERSAKTQVAAAAAQRATVVALLGTQQQVLNHAQAGLRAAITAQAAAEARTAALQRRQVLSTQGTQPVTPVAVSATSGTQSSGGGNSGGGTSGGGSSSGSGSGVTLPSGAGNAAAVSVAERYLGVPYVWGGASPSGFDCSGLMYYAYKQIGKYVPHYTVADWNAFPHVPLNQLQPGDLVFFGGESHVGMYIGGGRMIHAPHTGTVVQITSLSAMGAAPDGAVRP